MILEELNCDASSFVSLASLRLYRLFVLTSAGFCLQSKAHPVTGVMMMMWQVGIIFLLTEVSSFTNSTVSCLRPDRSEMLSVRSGESLYLPCSNLDCFEDDENTTYVWLKNVSSTMSLEEIGTEEHMRVHYHRSVLYILQLSVEDTGCYITRQFYPESVCHEFVIDLVVYEEFSTNLLFEISSVEGIVAEIFCPVCEYQKGTFIWYKNFSLISNQESGQILRIRDASIESEDIYTCVCFWEHGGRKLNSSASRRLVMEEQSLNAPPRIVHPINNSIELVDMDTEIGLKCSVFTGKTGRKEVTVGWLRNQTPLDGVEGYTVQEQREDEEFIHSVLLIRKVSQMDFYSVFHCTAEYSYEVMLVSVALKRRDVGASRLTLVSCFVCAVLLILMFSGTMKMFAVDLVLLLRGTFKKLNRKEDGKVYDAYVIYQRNNLDEATEKTISDFVTGALPTVLEKYYNYKLYIPARDDLPGEDCMNLTETKMQLSRRLIFIMTPGRCAHEHGSSPEGYDVQVGLHQALVQGDTGVILIQLEDMHNYTHLPLGLQHLLKKSPPLLWRDGGMPGSRFWKLVRYRMPVPSCQRDRVKKTSAGLSSGTEKRAALMYAIV